MCVHAWFVGIAFFVWQFFLFKPWITWLGPLRSSIVCQIILATTFASFPAVNYVAANASFDCVWVFLAVSIVLRSCMGSTQGASTMLLINNSARPDNRGSVLVQVCVRNDRIPAGSRLRAERWLSFSNNLAADCWSAMVLVNRAHV